jgi:hypothetical protein
LCNCGNQHIELIDVQTGETLHTLELSWTGSDRLFFTSDSHFLVSTGKWEVGGGIIQAWDTKTEVLH